MTDNNHRRWLSKSRYVCGLQCHKMIWLQVNRPDLAAPFNESTARVFELGHRVGSVAHAIFPGGVLIEEDHKHIPEAMAASRRAAESGAPAIFEATAVHNDVLCRADVLQRVSADTDLWDLYEVKSATSVKDQYLPDVAVQRYCLEGAGFPIRRAYVMHINNTYVRRGAIDPHQLLTARDVTDRTAPDRLDVEMNARLQLEVLAADDCPEAVPGRRCTKPYRCAFFAHCNDDPAPGSTSELRLTDAALARLASLGVTSLVDVPDGFDLNRYQRAQVESARTARPVVDRPLLTQFLQRLAYPLHFLDFETMGSAIPIWDETRPWKQIPFQFSLHVQRQPGGPCEHHSFLPADRADPRTALVDHLLRIIEPTGSIVAWNMSFEKHVVRDLAADFPLRRGDLVSLLPRFVDLMAPFRSGWYVDHRFRGSSSLKEVLPVMAPALAYGDLQIQHGDVASVRAEKWFSGDLEEQDWAALRSHMLAYCERDTEGMVRVLRALQDACRAHR